MRHSIDAERDEKPIWYLLAFVRGCVCVTEAEDDHIESCGRHLLNRSVKNELIRRRQVKEHRRLLSLGRKQPQQLPACQALALVCNASLRLRA